MKNMKWSILLATSFCTGWITAIHNSSQETGKSMRRVTSIGGIFFKCKNPAAMREWYTRHLGLNTDKYGTTFEWRHAVDNSRKGFTQWGPFNETTKYFQPSDKDFMINYRVENLRELVEQLKREGVQLVDSIETFEYGSFVHIMDIEGNKIELWEPNDMEYEKILGAVTR